MKIPEKLKIGGHNYKILYPYVFKERGDIVGQHDRAANEIRIATTDTGERADSSILVTLIHEVLHAIDDITGHEIFIGNEKAMEGISEGIFQVLVDNGFLTMGDIEDKSMNIRKAEKAGRIVLRRKGGGPI